MPNVTAIEKGDGLVAAVAAHLPDAHRVLTTADIARLVLEERGAANAKTVTRVHGVLCEFGALRRVRKGLFLNNSCFLPAADWEAAHAIRKGAVASLLTVLGESGVLNNSPRDVWCVIPNASAEEDSGGVGGGRDIKPGDDARTYQFLSINARVFNAPNREDALDESRAPALRATPEAALVHWLYLSEPSSRPGRRPLATPPIWDIDLMQLDEDIMHRVAEAMGIGPALDAWLANRDCDDEEKVTPGLGF